jgi:hypothetical protein
MKTVAVDWAKKTSKRSAYVADVGSRHVSRLPFDGKLASLLEYAASQTEPVLIGIDAAIGFPAKSWNGLSQWSGCEPSSFASFLRSGALPADFFTPVSVPDDWSPQQPFIRPPAGRWRLGSYLDVSDDGLHREIDRRLQANPIFVTSGMPGTVGSGTLALWQEIVSLKDTIDFDIWPFDTFLNQIGCHSRPVLAEIYPKACYGIALAEELPGPLRPIAKTNRSAREGALEQLLKASWIVKARATVSDWQAAKDNEDDFDALMSASALLRLFLEGAPLDSRETVDVVAEGGILGAPSITGETRRLQSSRPRQRRERRSSQDGGSKEYPCPIPGCEHVFHGSRGGWDAHIASCKQHPDWKPEITDRTERKSLFRSEFADWF